MHEITTNDSPQRGSAAPVCRLCGEKAELNSDDVCFDCWGGDAYKARLAEAARAAERPAATGVHVERIGHLGEIGRWLDNAPDAFVVARPKSVSVWRRTLVVMPRWFYVAALIGFAVLGFTIGRAA